MRLKKSLPHGFVKVRNLAWTLFILSISQAPLRADEVATLKPEYRELAANGATAINTKRWQTSRNGKVVLEHVERDYSQSGKFDVSDTMISHEGKKVLSLKTLQKQQMCIFYPESGLKVLQTDSDRDGRQDRIVLMDAKEQIVDCFILAADGRLAALTDEELKKEVEAQNNFSKTMKNFDKR